MLTAPISRLFNDFRVEEDALAKLHPQTLNEAFSLIIPKTGEL